MRVEQNNFEAKYENVKIISSSSSSCRAASTDIPDPLSPLFLSFIASGWFSGQDPVSSHICWMYVRAGRPAFARPYVGIHFSTSQQKSQKAKKQGKWVAIYFDSVRAKLQQYQIGNFLVIMTHLNSGFKNVSPSMKDWLSKCLEVAEILEWMKKVKTI